jgi:hypothetical protein
MVPRVIWKSLAATLALASAAPPALRPVHVPPALREVTSPPEPSGLVWVAALSRYLVVSDDTGLAARGTRHAPMLLAMDAAGTLDAAPVPITGIDALDDPEAICAGPGETVFVATSHSQNREGRTSRARRQLLHLALEGRSLRVIGRVDLTAVEGPRPLLAVAGLGADGRLDVEAIAFREGALHVGLKSPLSPTGAAVILRLADAAGALREGRIREGALTRWAEVPLCVQDRRGARVCQGLADLVFLDDGSLVAAANAPKGGPKDGGGAVWWLPAPVGTAPPRLLQRFPRLRPEGVARAPRGGLAVVFDRDQDAPLWTELPLPR